MESEYTEETRRLRTRFTIIYGATIVLLCVVFSALWLYYPQESSVVNRDMFQDDSEKLALLNEDAALHEGLMKLNELDMTYSKLIATSTDTISLANMNNLIITSQIDFSNMIDQLDKQKRFFKNPFNIEKSDAMIKAFITALNYRKSNDSLRMRLFNSGTNEKDLQLGTFTVLPSEENTQSKDDTIQNLLSQLKFQSQLKKYDFPMEQTRQPNAEIELLRSNVKRQTDSIKILLAVYKSLIKDNSNLTNQLDNLKLNTKTNQDETSMPDKINTLNNKIDDLNLDLAFAEIDCNLTRVNGKDIVYNSRQRKDLLQESLRSLKNLSNSTNPIVQRKVKTKLALLQNIAATVRD